MLLKEAYELGVQKALHDSGLIKEGFHVPMWSPAIGGGIGLVGGGLSDDSNMGIGALRGLSSGAGASLGAQLMAGPSLDLAGWATGTNDLVNAESQAAARRAASKILEHPKLTMLKGLGIPTAGILGGSILGGIGGYQLMKHFGPEKHRDWRERLGLTIAGRE